MRLDRKLMKEAKGFREAFREKYLNSRTFRKEYRPVRKKVTSLIRNLETGAKRIDKGEARKVMASARFLTKEKPRKLIEVLDVGEYVDASPGEVRNLLRGEYFRRKDYSFLNFPKWAYYLLTGQNLSSSDLADEAWHNQMAQRIERLEQGVCYSGNPKISIYR